ncbi:TetR family transcriptional regulator [Paenibacillus sp. FSL R7-0273]|uniref:TetR/AcrR family transcriptional regulator n=1 Tax=Paenibacillus sp. FSL R7-0273 TaxID=1536772 RepID=UPI0004F6F62D|nr:TetR/AcrR family transcriptional regulator [Paenibacillus sp. FSL R7-0273]AIQ49030.1 TetR family transcriptional regulator [Paenibacillus sp. FSL R7-0273]OMF90588.1 TetR family transcriptional regulator [Paenibacillus sp. FSL R7-0273]
MKNENAEQREKEQWIEEFTALKDEGQMTPKQISILEAAIEIFSDKGFSAASTSEIAQKAGVAEGTIFRYYKTKKDLLLSIVGPAMSRMIAPFVMRNFKGVLDMPFESYEAFLRAFIVNRLDFARKNFKIIRILVQEIPFQPALREQFAENVLAQVLERVTSITEHFKAKGEVINAPTPAIIRFTISSVIGYLLARLLLMPEKDWDDEEEISLLISFMLHGIGGPALRE